MPHHLAALTVSAADATETDITPVQDQILSIQNAHLVAKEDMALWWAVAMATNIDYARVVTPTLRAITPPYIRPLFNALVGGTNLKADLIYPQNLTLRKLEEIQIIARQTSGGAQRITVLLALGLRMTPPPAGDMFTMRGTSTSTATANVWSDVTVTWNDVLPIGTYAVVGLTHFGANGQAVRLIFNDQIWRPGGPSYTAVTTQEDVRLIKGNLGTWGTFDSNIMPNVQVLCNGATAAHEFYLDLIRLR